MGYRLSGIVFALVLGGSSPAFGDWHTGTFLLQQGGKEVGEQEFSIKRGEESGKWFMSSSAKGSLPKGANLFTVAHQVSAEGGIDHYKTVQKRKGDKPLRGIYFDRKGKLRCIPRKGVSKPVDMDLAAPDAPLYDKRILATWFVPLLRAAGKDQATKWTAFDVQSQKNVEGTLRPVGQGEVTRKKKKIAVQVVDVSFGTQSWRFAVDSSGRLFGGKGPEFAFTLVGVDLGNVLQVKEGTEEEVDVPSDLDAIGLPGDEPKATGGKAEDAGKTE